MSEIENFDKSGVVKKLRRAQLAMNLTLIIPVIVMTIIILAAIFAPVLAPHNPTKTALRYRMKPPAFVEGGSSRNILGTDGLGRDILSRMLYGTRVSLSISAFVILITASVGTALGVISGSIGGRADLALMRVVDVALSIPGMVVMILFAVVFDPGFWTVIFAMSILGWAPYARLIRGEALKIREIDFVLQARIIGASHTRIMLTHIFPNIVNSLIVVSTMQVGTVILAEAGLSFLGLGVPPPNPSWGAMVSDGRNLIDRAFWISFFPGLAIGFVVLSCNFLGDWLRDKLDPRLRQI